VQICPATSLIGTDVLRLESKVRRHERLGCETVEQLEDENAKLKKLLAEAMLDNAVLKDITSRKW
jgi:putative transposase